MILWTTDQAQTTRRYRGKHRKMWSLKRDIITTTLSYTAFVTVPAVLLTLLAVALEQR